MRIWPIDQPIFKMLGTNFLRLSLVTSDKYITLELLNPLNPKLIKNEETANNYTIGQK